MTFLKLKTIHNEEVRIAVDDILSYKAVGDRLTELTLSSGCLGVLYPIEVIDTALIENYIFIKSLT